MSLTHRDLAKLCKENEARNALTAIWHRKHKVDPVDAAKKIWEERRDYLSGKVVILLLSLIVFVALLGLCVRLNPIYSQSNPLDLFDPRLILLFACIASFVTFLTGAMSSPWNPTRYTDAEWNYPNLFGKFLEWGNKTAGDIVRLEEGHFVGIAKKVLSETAESVARKQNRAKRKVNKRLDAIAVSAKSFFEEQLRTFAALGIAKEDDHQSIFDKAERQIREQEEGAMAACSAEHVSVVVCRSDVFQHHLTRAIGVDGKITIGSDKSADIIIDSPYVAGIQCIIDTRYNNGIDDRMTIIENNAQQGTILNGILHTHRSWDKIKSGDEIQVRDYTLVIYLPETIASEGEASIPAVAS